MPLIDLAGRTFGRWSVLGRGAPAHKAKGAAFWLCRCICGAQRSVLGAELRRGTSRSCGCLHNEEFAARLTKHGCARTRAYSIWQNMIARTTRPTHTHFRYYGGRGISVCQSWRNFENFFADMGEPGPVLTLERVDNEKGYSPDNCVWATMAQQAKNKRPRGAKRAGPTPDQSSQMSSN